MPPSVKTIETLALTLGKRPVFGLAKLPKDCSSNDNELKCRIPVIISSRLDGKRKTNNFTVTANSYLRNMRNHLNLISVKINKPAPSNLTGSKEVTKFALPNIYLINARSLLSKVDELTATLNANSVNLVAVTETWLSEEMEDNLVSISGYNLFRKDRPCHPGGGVCAYLSEDILVKRHSDLENDNFGCMWLWLRPTRLPRPLSGIVICVVHHPPGLPEHEHSLLNI